jgi:hypothetical protein
VTRAESTRLHLPLRAALCSLALLAGTLPAAGAPGGVSGERAKAFVARIAALGPRPAGSAAERRAAGLVLDRFRALGYHVRLQSFRLPDGGTSRNVVALSPGPIRAIVVAHLDGVRAGPAANDNGSGVGALVEVARALRGGRGVLLAALGAEERVETGSPLHLGSARLLAGLSRLGRDRIRVALSLDMVGVGPTFNVRGLEPAPNRSAARALAVAARLGLPASYRQDNGLSDHAELTRAGLPAAWIEWRWDTCWHTACDVASRLDPRKLEAAALLALATVRDALRAP